MLQTYTVRGLSRVARRAAGAVVFIAGVWAQTPGPRLEWRRIGTVTLAEGLASPSSAGAVERVAFLADGSLAVKVEQTRAWRSAGGENWVPYSELPPAPENAAVARLPETRALVRQSGRGPAYLYAAGAQVWRSEDGGKTWLNLTETPQGSVVGAAGR